MKQFITIICILFLLNSCSQKNDLIGQWNVGQLDFVLDNPDYFLKMGKTSGENQSLILAKDGFFMYFDNSVSIGNWEYSDKNSLLVLNVLNDTLDSFQMNVKSLDSKKMSCTLDTIISEVSGTFEFECKKVDKDIFDSEYNFVSLKMNEWRIPAKQKEGKEQIKKRIEDGMNFAITYLKYYQSKDKATTTNFLKPLPFIFAGNGIGFEKNTDWEKLFFDEEDAVISYEIIKNAFKPRAEIPYEIQKKPISLNLFILEKLKQKVKEY